MPVIGIGNSLDVTGDLNVWNPDLREAATFLREADEAQ